MSLSSTIDVVELSRNRSQQAPASASASDRSVSLFAMHLEREIARTSEMNRSQVVRLSEAKFSHNISEMIFFWIYVNS